MTTPDAATLPPAASPSAAPLTAGAGRAIPGYEVLGELGRGGMGVVYKARQVGLGRLTAVKVILSGGHSGEQDLARFRQEAETLGRLKHPNIVQIYEVGEHDGLPFFSLEYCPGGSLDSRLNGSPLPPSEAAGLVATLARAMHAAHQAGIIHRDLKPANVLLDEDGTPRITDFGLAKRVEDGGGLTQSGVVMGTPSYMAPEQAGGHSGLVTTAADVYALGAILYECLTGRPPFRAATPLDTILQVLQREPEPPSSLRPGIDRRLELICLKCLSRKPSDRYASADALAADLEHWRAGEPVSVQPPALTALLRLWLRQNFGAAGWTVVVGLGHGVILSLLTWLVLIQPALKNLEPSYRRVTGDAPWLVAAWAAPPWLAVPLDLLGILAIGLSGLVTARLVRPRNRQADVAAGLVSGAVAGVVFFTLCFGWVAGLLRLEPSLKDVRLLSTAAWDDHEGAGRPPASSARSRMLEKYPGLRDVPARERGRVMHEKVTCDLWTGIPVAIWSGMFMSVGICVVVGVFGTALGGRLLRERGGVWKALLPYLEGVVPAALLCWWLAILVTPWVLGGRLGLPIWYIPLIIGVLGLTVMGVLRGWHWAARMPLHAAWIALQVASRWIESR
jgi:serine/threonine protein kinase